MTALQESKSVKAGSLLILGSALVGTILAIVGLTRRGAKKGAAIGGVIICGSFMLCQCFGLLMGLSSAG